ncbi:hypothetical protein SLEP1_g15111 [Rubroshorea leprosula]|uniref:Uncharacterized protein n=1 Tax=Rubroshorea leprosula TaxID=152421 RepID=A0AAV5ISA3_9ROSI|nr:hypothetical protein SLEP1_g15111 [Rubroshorea leprosula]
MIKFRALCICGTLSEVYSVCHVLGFGFWGVTLYTKNTQKSPFLLHFLHLQHCRIFSRLVHDG